ncbi:MAG: hypothetical protein F4X66_08535 [Chloroflexi bacterium]|nr:hypothetical protein [Chloroflexota bacterium]
MPGVGSNQSLIGKTGEVTRILAPRGVVRVASDTWTAISADGEPIEAGVEVMVIDVQGLVLTVARSEYPY